MIYFETENELYHHGVKGQKWGVRRYQNKDGSRTPLGKRMLNKLETNRVYDRKGNLKSTKRLYAETASKAATSAATTALTVYLTKEVMGKKVAAVYGGVGAGMIAATAALDVLAAKDRAKGKFAEQKPQKRSVVDKIINKRKNAPKKSKSKGLVSNQKQKLPGYAKTDGANNARPRNNIMVVKGGPNTPIRPKYYR